MCFSASASFTGGVLLTVIGVETLKKVHKPAQMVFACIPLFFALQQFTEGILWLSIGRHGYGGIQAFSTYLFLILAEIVWPAAVPLSVLLIEDKKPRKKILTALLIVGAVVALFNIYGMIFYGPRAEVSSMHIAYISDFRLPFGNYPVIFYLAATILPLFISSVRRMHVLGSIMAASFLVSFVFYTKCLTSVWCFFAAVISFMVYYIIRDAHKKKFKILDLPREKKG